MGSYNSLAVWEMTIPSETAYDPATHVSVDDMAKPKTVMLRLKASKIDPFRKGVEIVLGRTDDAVCPVAALRQRTRVSV